MRQHPGAAGWRLGEEIAQMPRKLRKKGLSKAELAKQGATELPDREAMSLVNANVAAPINLAAALNVLSDNSIAYANAEQTAPITQST
jgi:hypothetical protein